RDITMPFDGERKIVRRLVTPFFECAFLLKPVKGAVDLNSGETFRAKPEPLLLRRVAIKPVAPTFVVPAADADVCFAGHYWSLLSRSEERRVVEVCSFSYPSADR